MATAKEKREEVVSKLRYLRSLMKEVHDYVRLEEKMPEPEKVRGAMESLQDLISVLEPKKKKREKNSIK